MEGYFELAKYYHIQGDEQKELDIYMKMLNIEPESPVVYYRIADVYYRLNQLEEALDYNNRLLEIEDDDYLNYTQRCNILIAMNRYAEAVHSFDQALELHDQEDIRFHKSYILFLNGDFDQSLEELYSIVQRNPSFMEDPIYHFALGRNYRAIQNYELAIQSFSTVIQMAPDDPDYRIYRAECYLETGQYESAVEDLTAAIQQRPEQTVCYSMRGNAYYAMGRYEQAKEDVCRWLELEPDSPSASYYLGLIEYELSNLEAAQRMVDQSLALDETYYPSYLLQAYIHYSWFNYDECEDWIVKWATTLYAREGQERMNEAVYSLEGIDQPILDGAVSKLKTTYGDTVYLS